MALTPEIIKQNDALKQLSDDVITAFVTLATNEETRVVNERTGKMYGDLDNDILEATGIPKKDGEKTYDYNKRAFGILKQRSDKSDLTKELDEAKAETVRLKKVVSDNAGDAEVAQRYRDAQLALNKLQEQYDTDKKDWDKTLKTREGEFARLRVEQVLNQTLSGVRFKPEDLIPKDVRQTIIRTAMADILNTFTPEWQKNDDGTTSLVFRNAQGEIVTNPKNLQKPYTAEELMLSRIEGIILKDADGSGAGGAGKNDAGGGGANRISLEGLATQSDAEDRIRELLRKQGLVYGSADYQKRQKEVWAANPEIQKLPLR